MPRSRNGVKQRSVTALMDEDIVAWLDQRAIAGDRSRAAELSRILREYRDNQNAKVAR